MIYRCVFVIIALCLLFGVGFFGYKIFRSIKDRSKPVGHDMPNTITVSSKGVVTGAFEEPFDESIYSADELKKTIDDEIAVYNGLAGDEEAIKLDSFDVKDNVAYVKLVYATPDDYRGFNGLKLYAGKVSDLVPLTVIVDKELFAVKEGDEDITPDSLKSVSGRKILCLEEEANIALPGNILYFSSGVELTGKRTARVHDIEGTAFVIYK